MKRTGIGIALFALMALSVQVAAQDAEPPPAVLDPSQDRGDQYSALTEEINRQLAAMQSDYDSRHADVLADIERRRQELYASTDDVFARNDRERTLNQLKQQAINELQSELGVNRRLLSDLRSEAAAELGRNGVLSEAMWGSIIDFSAAHLLALPEGFGTDDDATVEYEGFPAAIYDCTEYVETFPHPYTGDPMVRNVYGVVDQRCHYEEQLPADGLMVCHYSLERLPAVADFYANIDKYENLSISSSTEWVDGRPVTTNTYTLDGEPYDHPLDAALAAGECAIREY